MILPKIRGSGLEKGDEPLSKGSLNNMRLQIKFRESFAYQISLLLVASNDGLVLVIFRRQLFNTYWGCQVSISIPCRKNMER